ncbi:hypothetical protein NDU88_001921 [Pleurodeles waltl]|uniref:Uncharacterized protein n=1 Tax=Pleurodeles waltl TaxID=8319 RepID=A0AAV7LB03_PLEWA|nr:hypothetical protein NDU88_001921 [Pleurodeles waltl]
MTAHEAVSISAGECSATPIVHHARETAEKTDVDNEAENLTPGPQMGGSRPLRTAAAGRRRCRQTHDAVVTREWVDPAISRVLEKLGHWIIQITDAILAIVGDRKLIIHAHMKRLTAAKLLGKNDIRLYSFMKALGLPNIWRE